MLTMTIRSLQHYFDTHFTPAAAALDEYYWLVSTLGLLSSVALEAKQQKKAEGLLVKFVQVTEAKFGGLEVANAYYLAGVFYFELRQMTKAVACFERSLGERKVGSAGQSDCLFNLGLIYKIQQKDQKAMACFKKCL